MIFNSLEEFIKEVKSLGVKKIAFAETFEKRAVEGGPGELKVDIFRLLELIAYSRPSLYKLTIKYPDFESVYNSLKICGFEVTRSKRNIT